MDNRSSLLPAAASLFATSCLQCTLVYLTTLNAYAPGPYYPLMLLPYSLVLFAANRLFLRRERTVLGLVLLNGGLSLAAFLSVVLVNPLPDWGSLLFAALFCLWLAARAGQLAWSPPTLFQLILSVDLCLAALALFTAYLAALELPVSWCAPIAAGCAASILGLIVYRSGSSLNLKSGLFLAAVFAGVFAMVWLLVGYLAAPAGEGLVTLWNWLVSAVLFLLGQLWRLLVFLTSLLPPAPAEELTLEPEQIQMPEQEETLTQANPVVLAVFLAILALAALVLAIRLALRLRRLRLAPHTHSVRISGTRAGRISLLAGLRRLLAGLWSRLVLRLTLWRNRNTAWGLYFLLVRRSAPTPWHKLRGETPREFLTRLREGAAGDQDLAQALDRLIPAVDLALFSPGGPEGELPQAPLIRRRLGRAMGLLTLRQLVSRLPGLRSRLAGENPGGPSPHSSSPA